MRPHPTANRPPDQSEHANTAPPPKPRSTTPNLAAIPRDLADLRQWVCWAYSSRDNKKWTKVPHRADCPAVLADTTRSDTWAAMQDAYAAYQKNPTLIDGIGFVFSKDGGHFGVDLDNCLGPDGKPLDWAKPYIESFGATYGDRSPSGRGIKFFGRGSIPDGKGRKLTGLGAHGDGAIEVYEQGRYFTVTGDIWDEGLDTVEDMSDALSALLAEIQASKQRPARSAPVTNPPTVPAIPDDDDLIAKARGAKNGDEFRALFDQGDTSRHQGDDSSADLALMNRLAWWCNGDAERMERIFGRSALGRREKWTERPDYRQRTIDEALRTAGPGYDPPRRRAKTIDAGQAAVADDSPSQAEARPDVEVSTERHQVVEQTIEALTADPEIYRRGNSLVYVVVEPRATATLQGGVVIQGIVGSPRITMLSEAILSCYMTRNANFYTWKKDRQGEDLAVRAQPPNWLTTAVHEEKRWPGIRPLLSIAESPFICPDGRLVTQPGYDAITGILYRPSIEFPPIPTDPTKADAEAAANRLLAVVADMPFASDADRAVFLAGVLLAVIRPVLPGPAPGIAVIGNKAACGKGLLIDVIGNVAIGRDVPVSSYPDDPEEAKKVKLAIALSGKTMIHFDNLAEGSTYGNPALDSALTATEVDDRILGGSALSGTIAMRAMFMLSGNNVHPGKDAYRRWTIANLKTPLERPEERDDIRVEDLREYVRQHRAGLVVDALTILKAHALAGYPGFGKPLMGSFQNWDRMIRRAVHFATGWDCAASMRDAADSSPEKTEKVALLTAWAEHPQGRAGLTSKKAIDDATTRPDLHKTLSNFLIVRCSKDGKTIDPRKLGNYITGIKGATFAGLRFEEAGKSHGAVLWKVEGELVVGELGESGELLPSPSQNALPSGTYAITSESTSKFIAQGLETDSPDSPNSPQPKMPIPPIVDIQPRQTPATPATNREVFEL